MALFSTFALKVLPLYLNILLGYIAGKLLKANRETIARIMLFIVNPLVIFNGVVHTHLDASVLILPVFTFTISSCLCLWFYKISCRIWNDSTCNLVAFSAGSGNTGYFGIPLALLLFNNQAEGLYIMALLGVTFYENTLGYYIFVRHTHSAMECLYQLIKLPALYAFLAGLVVNVMDIPDLEVFSDFIGHVKGTYTVLGMMIIGMGLSSLTSFKIDFKFIGMTFLAKFVLWPLIIITLINVDIYFFGFFNEIIYNALMLISIVPLAANMVILATLQKSYPEKAACAVLISTLFALIYIPVMASFFIRTLA
jgi:predicted permease